jgi:hypothetical protein
MKARPAETANEDSPEVRMAWSPRLRVSFTDDELVTKLAATHSRPEERTDNWFTFYSNLPAPERARLDALAAVKAGAPPPAPAARPSRPARQKTQPAGAPTSHPTRHARAAPDADKTLKELLAAAKEMTDAARQLARQMNDLAGRIADAAKGAASSR